MASTKSKSSERANEGDFLGEGGTYSPQTSNIEPRATTPDGLFFLDTGEPTPLYIRRQQAAQGLIANNSFSEIPKPAGAKLDPQKGQYYVESNGRRVYISNDPAAEFRAQQTPIFTVNALPKAPKDYLATAQAAGMGAAAGAKLGGAPGALVGAGFGAAAALPQATGRQLYLTQGSGEVPGRQGTAAEAAQANANYLNTGNSRPPGGGNNYFPLAPQPLPATYQPGGPMPTNNYTNQGSNNAALSAAAQGYISNANALAAQNQAQAQNFYGQAAAAGGRAAPQMTAPSSANQQAVYDRAMNFNAQSGADAIRAERADISGASRLENYQLDQQGINNLEAFQSTNSQQGVDQLYAFNTRKTDAAAQRLGAFQATNTAQGAEELRQFQPFRADADAEALRNFQHDREGIDRLRDYALQEEGPSAAQAMLRSQADEDKRTLIAGARSGRGVAGSVQALRGAIAEGGLRQAETLGQAAALRAQETEAFKARQLQALAQMGQQISAGEAMRLQGMAQAGQLMSAADQQKLAAVQAYAQVKATQDSQILSAQQSAGQLAANADNMRLGAVSNAAQLQGQMDQQRLGAISNAASLRTQGDAIRSNNLQAAGQMRLAGSEINQRGAIAASQADLQAQALNLQSLSLAGNISTEIRNQDIQVLRSNLDAQLQTLGLNDQQVRFFSQLGSDREIASQNMQQQAQALGVNVAQAQQALDLQWAQFGLSQLSQQQQAQYQQQLLAQNSQQFNAQNALANQQQAMQQQQINYNQQQQNRQNTLNTLGTIFQGASLLFQNAPSSPPAGNAQAQTGPTGGYQTSFGTSPANGNNAMGMIYDPFTGNWVYPSASGTPQAQSSNNYYGLAGNGGSSYGV